jgi:archaellum biogenesis ATPase FlaH
MIKTLLKNPEYPKELQEAALEELRDTDNELEIIQGTPKRSNKSAFVEEIGLRQPEQSFDKPIFLSPSNIKRRKRDMSKIIRSGIDQIDKNIIGFNPRELSVWSGSNGSGKSTVLSQIAIEAVDQKFKVALFSGELNADRVLEWVDLQCAGKQFTESTQYINYFRVQNEAHDRINKWLEGKLFIYNNDYGNNVNKVLKAVMDCIKTNNVNMVIIDNMMSLDVAGISGDKYDRQASLVIALCEMAKQYNVHIHFVAHPRKAIGFLRKTDISGTADITNAADNVFIVHRVNRDFKNATKQDLGFKEDNILYQCSNVIEICKNRDIGIQDVFAGTVFEPESKRFKNTSKETKRYGWEANESGFMSADEPLPFD